MVRFMLFVLLSGIALSSWPHGGGLNAQGCHTNRKTGDYHCHRAQAPATPAAPVAPTAPAVPTAAADGGAGGAMSCGAKRTCGEMSGCEEARFYLTQCGVSRLDGDKDGTPCEELCR
jgi:hypothetical protein